MHSIPDHIQLPSQYTHKPVAITGGSGRLGASLTFYLTSLGFKVRVLDLDPPSHGIACSFRRVDLERERDLRPALEGSAAVVHLAALHGPDILKGVPRKRFWSVNVNATARALRASGEVGVSRFVLASSTSVYGSGSAAGQAARVLDENTPVAPENIYDVSKLAAERFVLRARSSALSTVSLRFGRFFFPSQEEYHLRKLSTGLDVYDACQAVAAALLRPLGRQPVYCVASDLPLDREARQRMGTDLETVLDTALPGFLHKIRSRGWPLPGRVGKSVDTSLIQRELGYVPARNLAWLNDSRGFVPPAGPPPGSVRPTDGVRPGEDLRVAAGGSRDVLADAFGWTRGTDAC